MYNHNDAQIRVPVFPIIVITSPNKVVRENHQHCYSGPSISTPPIQPGKFGLKFEVVLKWRDI